MEADRTAGTGITDCHDQFANWSRNDNDRCIGTKNNGIGPASVPHQALRASFPPGEG